MLQYIKHEFKKIFIKQETWIVIAICFGIALAGIVETLNWFPDKTAQTARLRMYRSLMIISNVGQVYLLFFGMLLASIPCACSYFTERTNNSDIILISKSGRTKYYVSKMIVTAITGFIVSVLPLVIQYLFCMIAIPQNEFISVDSNGAYGNINNIIMTTTIFPRLYMNNPDLCVFVHIGIFGLWAMGITMLTYTISLYSRKNLVITMSISAIINLALALIYESVGLRFLSLYKYLNPAPGTYNFNFPAFAIEWGVLILINIVLLGIKIRKKKDII